MKAFNRFLVFAALFFSASLARADYWQGGNKFITNSVSNGNLSLQVKVGSTPTNVLSFTGSTGAASLSGVLTATSGVKFRSGSPGNDTLTAFTDSTIVTPTLASSNATQPTGVTYSVQTLKYSRVGSVMFYDVRIDFTTFTCGSPCNTGGVRIAGLPLPASGSGSNGTNGICNASNLAAQAASTTNLQSSVGTGASVIDIFWAKPTGGFQATNFTTEVTSSGTTKSIVCTGYYFL